MITASIFGATGYAGSVLASILLRHPEVKIGYLATSSQQGTPYSDIYPAFYKLLDLQLCGFDDEEAVDNADIIFTALPHAKSAALGEIAYKKGKKIVDISADFRLNDGDSYNYWYKTVHPCPYLLKEAVYGLPELNTEAIKKASIIANPGCYPTTAILALAPLLAANRIDTKTIIIDSKSGVSGAGRNAAIDTSFVEVNENFKAYNIGKHRHTPEIEQELSKISGQNVLVTFSPHLVPMNRGMLSTCYGMALKETNTVELVEYYKEFYKNAPFVRVLDAGKLPQTRWVSGSNFCDIGIVYDDRTGRIAVVSAIDNLVKGAAGQAVQNMNIMYGFDETTALLAPAMIP